MLSQAAKQGSLILHSKYTPPWFLYIHCNSNSVFEMYHSVWAIIFVAYLTVNTKRKAIWPFARIQGFYSLMCRASYRLISRILEASRSGVKPITLLGNLAGNCQDASQITHLSHQRYIARPDGKNLYSFLNRVSLLSIEQLCLVIVSLTTDDSN